MLAQRFPEWEPSTSFGRSSARLLQSLSGTSDYRYRLSSSTTILGTAIYLSHLQEMVLEILGPIFGIAAGIVKLTDHGFKLSAAKEDMNAAGMLLSIITDSAKSVRFYYDQLTDQLTSEQKQRIETALCRTDHLLHVSSMALNRRSTASKAEEDEMLGLTDKLAWVFRDKGKVIIYRTVLEALHNVLLGLSTELAMLRNIHGPVVGPPAYTDVIYSEQSKLAIVAEVTSYAAPSNMENGELSPRGGRIVTGEDLKRTYTEREKRGQVAIDKFEDIKSEAAEDRVEFSITADLKKKYIEKATRAYNNTDQSQTIVGDLKRRYSEKARTATVYNYR